MSIERFERPGFVLEPIPSTRVLRLTRNEEPFKKVQELVGVLDEVETQLRLVDRAQYGLLIDTRRVIGRTDPGFERAFRHWRERIVGGFARVAVLVQTPEGREQAARHAEELGGHVFAFDDEAAAVAWLSEVRSSA